MSEKKDGKLNQKFDDAVEVAEEVANHPFAKWMAQFGFYTKGFLFIVIGVLAIMVAIGDKYGMLTDPTGALSAIAQITFGKILLMIFSLGALGHGVWNILRGAADIDGAGKDWKGIIKRIIPVGIGIFYIYLAWKAFDLVITANIKSANGTVQKTFVTILLNLPLGAILVSLIGLGVISAGIHEFYSGITGKYQENFKMYKVSGDKLIIINFLGYFGFVARAVIFLLMGYFFISAAFYYDPKVAIGLDGALLTLSHIFFGKILLFITAVGLVCHGILSLYEAKYRRIN